MQHVEATSSPFTFLPNAAHRALIAHGFHNVRIGKQVRTDVGSPGFNVGLWVVDRDFDLKMAKVLTAVALNEA
jgi:hypothetical protein